MLSLFLANLVLSVLHFLVLSLRPMLAASSINLSVLHKSLNLDESSVMSSAKSRSSNTVVKFHCIPLLLSAVVFLMIQFMASNNKNPEITHPCFTPDLILNQSDICIYVDYYSHHLVQNSTAPQDVPQAISWLLKEQVVNHLVCSQ